MFLTLKKKKTASYISEFHTGDHNMLNCQWAFKMGEYAKVQLIHRILQEGEKDNVRNVLQKMYECDMPLNDKCIFRLPRVTFFGHTLGSHRMSPSEEKVVGINNACRPKDVVEVRSFLGLVQCCSITDCSRVEEPPGKVSLQHAVCVEVM